MVVYFLSSLKYALVASFVSGLLLNFMDKKPMTNAFEDQMCDENAFPHPLEACDGKEDPISFETIGQNEGYCMNGRCYSMQTLINYYRQQVQLDSFTRRPFSPAHKQMLRVINKFDEIMKEYVKHMYALGQYYAVLRQLRAELALYQLRNNWDQGDYPFAIQMYERMVEIKKRTLSGIIEYFLRPEIQFASNGNVPCTNDELDKLVNQMHVYHIENRINNNQWIVRLSPRAKEEVKKFYNGYLKFTRESVVHFRVPTMNGYDRWIALA